MEITQDLVKQMFDYRDDGNLIWKVNRGRNKTKGRVAGGSSTDGIYRVVSLGNRQYKVHRLIYLWHKGELPKEVDHKNNNCTDNKIENLRKCCREQNQRNRTKTNKTTSSKYKGVHFNVSTRKWIAKIGYKNRSIYLGRFTNKAEAAQAYNLAAQKLFSNFANLNNTLQGDT